MTRRDRAAMALALELLRGDEWFGYVADALRHIDVLSWAFNEARLKSTPASVLRCRVALLIRAALRADAGDLGRMVCTCFGEPRDVATHHDARHCRKPHPARYVAWYAQAPATGTATRPAGLRRRGA